MTTSESPWASPSALLASRARMIEQTCRAIAAYECRYELSSADLEQALHDGILRETAEISDWLVKLDLFRALTDDGPARLE